MATLQALHDAEAIRAYLNRQPMRHIYELGDLDPFFWPQTVWYGWVDGTAIEQLALLYVPGGAPVLLTHANDAGTGHEQFVQALCAVLPKRFYAHIDTPTMQMLGAVYAGDPHGAYRKMGLQDRARALAADAGEAKMLTINDIQALERLYAEAYPGNWFDARMVQTGCYAGIWQGDVLVAAAGIHVVSERERVAGLGNVTSHPTVRGQGYARQVCARLLRHLDALGIAHIGLNVAAGNGAAIALYQKLGFTEVAEYYEWSFTSQA